MVPTLSIVVPVLDEAAGIQTTLHALAPLRQRGAQVIVVDGGSSDHSVRLANPLADLLVHGPRGRARQMNAGAAQASAEVLLFLHADTQLPALADELVHQALAAGAEWGRFDVRISGQSALLPVVAWAMNWRSRSTGVATGDQALFLRREVFEAVGGFPDQPLMEDVELSLRLLRRGRPACLRQRVLTSGRRWETRGVWRTIFLMWRLRWRYWRGASPQALAQAYR
jgi:rSAM/selenodomain-associated transferase 2